MVLGVDDRFLCAVAHCMCYDGILVDGQLEAASDSVVDTRRRTLFRLGYVLGFISCREIQAIFYVDIGVAGMYSRYI